jgi:hypothetical protein
MICPHCRANLQRKQRTGNRCSSCRREFALDPKTNPLRLHDLRVHALAERLATRGRDGQPPLRFTADQLRLAASRKVLTGRSSSGWLVGAGVVGVAGGIVAVSSGATVAVGALVVLVLAGLLVLGHVLTADQRRYPGLPVSAAQFAALLARWHQVHGRPPAGLLPDGPPRTVVPAGPVRAVLVCPDAATVAFLAAAGVAERHPVVLVVGVPGRIPPEATAAARDGLPVLVLHDADPLGCLAAPRLRAVLRGGPVVDVGLRPAVARTSRAGVRVRPHGELVAELRATGGLAPDELAWLEEGNTVPLAAVLPARLLRAVERAVERAVVGADPDRERARAIGFLSSP